MRAKPMTALHHVEAYRLGSTTTIETPKKGKKEMFRPRESHMDGYTAGDCGPQRGPTRRSPRSVTTNGRISPDLLWQSLAFGSHLARTDKWKLSVSWGPGVTREVEGGAPERRGLRSMTAERTVDGSWI